MSTRKRLLSLNLALLMVLSLAAPARAEVPDTPPTESAQMPDSTPAVEPTPAPVPPSATEDVPPEPTQALPEGTEAPEAPSPTEPAPPSTDLDLMGSEVELEGIYPALRIDGEVVEPGSEGEGWRYEQEGELVLYDFSGTSINYTKGDLMIDNFGISRLDARFRVSPALYVSGDLVISNYGRESELDIYAWSTSSSLETYGVWAQNINIYNSGTLRVRGGCDGMDGVPRATAVYAEGKLSLYGKDGYMVAYGTPALSFQRMKWSADDLSLSVSDHIEDAPRKVDEYNGEHVAIVEAIPSSLRLHGCGGTWTIDGKEFFESANPTFAGAILYLEDYSRPERNGYDLLGWSTAEDGRNGEWYGLEDMVEIPYGDGGLDLHAQWQVRKGAYRVRLEGRGYTFEDGRGACILGFDRGGSVTIPDLDVGEETLLGWTEENWGERYETTETTKWYFPGDTIKPKRDMDLNPRFTWANSTYGVYHGGGGVSNTGHDTVYQLMNGSSTDLTLYGEGAFTRSDDVPFGGWNASEDWSGEVYEGYQTVDRYALKGKQEFYAMWGKKTHTTMTLTQKEFPYTGCGLDLSGTAETEVRQGGTAVESPRVRYEFFASGSGGNALAVPPTHTGTYWVQAHHLGDQALFILPSVTAGRLGVTITRSTPIITFPDDGQSYLWTGDGVTVRPPKVSLGGVPAEVETRLSYSRDGPQDWVETPPADPGDYLVKAAVAGTSDYERAESLPAAFHIANFVAQPGRVLGNADLTIPAGVSPGQATAVIALYDPATGRMRAVTQQTVTLDGSMTVPLRDIELDAYDGAGSTVKIFLLDGALKPILQEPAAYRVE